MQGQRREHGPRRRAALWRSLRSLLYIRLPGWDPEGVLRFDLPIDPAVDPGTRVEDHGWAAELKAFSTALVESEPVNELGEDTKANLEALGYITD